MNKQYKRVFAIMLAIVVLCVLPGCQSDDQVREKDLPQPTALDYARFQTTQEEVEAQHAEFGKVPVKQSEAEFVLDRVWIMVYPFANDVEYTKEDFSEIGCTRVWFVTENMKNDESPSRTISLSFDAETRQDIFDALEILIQRDDVYCAGPVHYIYGA